MTRKPLSNFFVASCVCDGGVYHYCLFEDGTVELLQKISMRSPMYIQQYENTLWAVLRAPFEETKESGVVAYNLTTGEQKTNIISTMGEVACHIAIENEDVYCANYVSGSVFKAPNKLDEHQGHGLDSARQTSPHVHSVYLSPDKKYVLSCDLGLDKIFVYDRNLKLISTETVPGGAGARHMVFSKDGNYVYCANEMGGSISVFSYQCGTLRYMNTLSILPADFHGIGSTAAIKLSVDGTRLYVTERTTQNIVTVSVNGANLNVVARTYCHGKEPRDFTLLAKDSFAVCTNQFDNNIALFRISANGIPIFLDKVELSAPLCAIEVEKIRK